MECNLLLLGCPREVCIFKDFKPQIIKLIFGPFVGKGYNCLGSCFLVQISKSQCFILAYSATNQIKFKFSFPHHVDLIQIRACKFL